MGAITIQTTTVFLGTFCLARLISFQEAEREGTNLLPPTALLTIIGPTEEAGGTEGALAQRSGVWAG